MGVEVAREMRYWLAARGIPSRLDHVVVVVNRDDFGESCSPCGFHWFRDRRNGLGDEAKNVWYFAV